MHVLRKNKYNNINKIKVNVNKTLLYRSHYTVLKTMKVMFE